MACLDCNDGTLPTSLGDPGTSSYTYIGFADDDSGSNFSLIQDGRCYISFLVSDTDLSDVLDETYFTNGWTNICCPDCDPVVETDLTGNNTVTVNLSTSGTANHTLEADVNVSATADNILTIEADGLYVEDQSSAILADVIAWLQTAFVNFTYDSLNETFTIDDADIEAIIDAYIVESIDGSTLVNGDVVVNGSDEFEIVSISREVAEDALASSFTDLTYDDGTNAFTFTPSGTNGYVWTTVGGVAQWSAVQSSTRLSTTIDADYTVNPAIEEVIFVDTSTGDITVTLPDATLWLNKELNIKVIEDSNELTIDTDGGDIDNNATLVIGPFDGLVGVKVKSDGSNWWILTTTT